MRETPEQFHARTGKTWAERSAVYMQIENNEFRIKSFREAKSDAECCEMDKVSYVIYCANTDDGMPNN